jgi:hypothetical protein
MKTEQGLGTPAEVGSQRGSALYEPLRPEDTTLPPTVGEPEKGRRRHEPVHPIVPAGQNRALVQRQERAGCRRYIGGKNGGAPARALRHLRPVVVTASVQAGRKRR